MYTKLTDIRKKIAAESKNEMTVLEEKLDIIAEKLGFDLANILVVSRKEWALYILKEMGARGDL